MSKGTFYITTPIYYPSGNPHIGHCYTTVACDSIARYKRMQGYDVMFLTGTDEHGLKIEQKANEKGVTPKEYVDEIVEIFKNLWSYMNISYDRYIRTTDDYHVEAVQKIFKALYDKGYIYKGEYTGKYCTPCESFWTDSQLVDGKCPECGRDVIEAKEGAYFFKMAPFAERLEKLLLETDFLRPKSRAVELVNNFIKPGLEDLCVSRTTFKWGIPVTFDDKHVIYVWIDALSNYITALGYQNGAHNDFDKFWPADVHMVAKDIMRFHAIIWPAMLMALDLPLPKHLAVHGWITFNGQKMSKSIGNVVDPLVLGKRYSPDAIRYHILREMALGADSSFSNEIMINRINSDLANDLGNLVSRTVAMVIKYFDGTLLSERQEDAIDDELISMATSLKATVDSYVEETQLNNALAEIFKVISRANKYIDETAPWALAKDENQRARLNTVLYNLLETIRISTTLLSAFMPSAMPKVWEQIGATEADVAYDNADKFGVLPENVTVHKGEVLFPRIDVTKEIDELNAIIEENVKKATANEQKKEEPKEETPEIAIDDFAKVSLKVAEIKSCEKVPKSDKLYQLKLDDGEGERQIVSGIAMFYKPEELIGKKVIIVANLKPAKLRGVMSNGMLLAADKGDEASVIFVDDSIPAGSKNQIEGSMNNIFDSHAHYDDEKFSEDREAVIAEIHQKGVSNVINVGCDIESSRASIKLAEEHDFFYAAVGIHPHSAAEAEENYLSLIEEMAKSKKVVAIGEIGLDYHYDFSPREAQLKVFEEQLILANKLDMPVIIHSREATEDTMRLLSQYRPKGVVHCFTGSKETAKEVLKLGMYIGFTGVVTFPNARKTLEVIDVTPTDRFLLETDCPYMAPVPFRGKRTTSDMIEKTAETVAKIKGISTQEAIDFARENTINLFFNR